jgi:hypothetical protein
MDSFLKETENEQFSIRKITKSGFSRSKRKLAPEAFLELNDIIWKDFYEEVDFYGYHGHKLLAVDGTYLNLPNYPSIHDEFDRRGIGRGKKKNLPKSMCLLSALYDPVNYLTLDVQTGPTDGNEQDLLLKHLPKVDRGDILLLDRGYPATALFADLQSMGIHFIVRMKQNWLPVKEFMASRKRDTIVTLTLSDGYYEKYKEQFPAMKKEIKCRLVKIALENGEEEILGTSLLESAKYKLPELGELYQIRWGTEEGHKMFKARVQVEAFSGKTATAVKQDIYAKVMMMTLCAALAFHIEEKVIAECNADQQNGNIKHSRKINRTFAYWSTKCILIGMFIKRTVRLALAVFDKQVAANTEIVRPGRHEKRKRRPPRLYHMNYKDV